MDGRASRSKVALTFEGVSAMPIVNIHHVAYRCRDAKETVDFYHGLLGMTYFMAVSEDRVPSTKEPDPYMHIFFKAGKGAALAFFELPKARPMGKDPNTPAWVQHIAFQVGSVAELKRMKAKLERKGIDVLGPTDHGFCRSIYFFDPNGHRVELAADTSTKPMMRKLKRVAPRMLRDWTRQKKTLKNAAFLHEKEWEAGAVRR